MGHLVIKEGDHTWETLHHTNEEGKHWCPTGIEWCPVHEEEFCGESREGEDVCFYWDEIPETSDLTPTYL